MEAPCAWGARKEGQSTEPAVAELSGLSFEGCQAMCCHATNCKAVSYATGDLRANANTDAAATCRLLQQAYEPSVGPVSGSFVANLVSDDRGERVGYALCVLSVATFLYPNPEP